MATKTKANGTGGAADTKAPASKTTSTTKTPPKPNGVEVKATPDINERMQKVEQLRGVIGKREMVVDTLNNLKTFSFSASDSCQLIIQDSEEKKFSTFNSNLIGLLSEHLRGLLETKKADLDQQILSFEL